MWVCMWRVRVQARVHAHVHVCTRVHVPRYDSAGDGFLDHIELKLAIRLATGDEVQGPAIIQEATTTIVVYPDMSARLSAAGDYILDCS